VGREESFRVGDRVSHKVFGEGLVLETQGQGDGQSLVVSFSSDKSQRKLMVKYARLTRVERAGKDEELS
jgi:DNA helicase-2/ATP-dependent DNA helicase PcrA